MMDYELMQELRVLLESASIGRRMKKLGSIAPSTMTNTLLCTSIGAKGIWYLFCMSAVRI
jgi:hypothetical protein